jgi:alpha-tubulin suppressor-like RCC1 family protein
MVPNYNLVVQALLFGVRVVSVACGAAHVLVIGETGALWSCGSNARGQLGTGSLIGATQLAPVLNLP